MKPPRRLIPLSVLLFVALWLAGCESVIEPKYKVLVDSISSAGQEKPVGKSYRLVAKNTLMSTGTVRIAYLKAYLDAALTGIGMFEAPSNVAPDIFVQVGFGRDSGSHVDPATRESFLQISARTNPGHSLDHATGPEVWDVKVALLGLAGPMETALPLLATVASNYVGVDTHSETTVEIPKKSPTVEAVRTTGLKNVEKDRAEALAKAGVSLPSGQPENTGTAMPAAPTPTPAAGSSATTTR